MLPAAIVTAALIWGGVSLQARRYEPVSMAQFSDARAVWIVDRLTGQTSVCIVGSPGRYCEALDRNRQ